MPDRLLRNAQGLVDHTFLVGTTPTDPDGNTATVDITRGSGTVFAAAAATVRQSAGIYRYTLAPQANLERFTFVFKGTFGGVAQQSSPQIVEVVGGFYVSLVDIRAQEGLSNATTYSNARLAEARTWFEDRAELFCGQAFVPRYRRDVLDGDGSAELALSRRFPRSLLSVKIAGVAQTGLTTWDLYDHGLVARDIGSFASGRRNVEIIYEHGRDMPDADVREAALAAIRAHLLGDRGGIPPNMSQMSVDGMTQTFRDPTQPTGIKEVDDVLLDHCFIVVG